MKSRATHHAIGQLRLDLRLDYSGADAQRHGKALQQRVTMFCRQHLEQVLAPLLDQAAPSQSLIRIRKIELDLGSIAIDGLEGQLAERLRRALAEQLRLLGLPLSDAQSGVQEPSLAADAARRPLSLLSVQSAVPAAAAHAALELLSPELCQLEMLSALLQGRADRRTARLGWDTLLHALTRWEPARLASLLRRELRSEHARRRLLRGLSSQGRQRLWRQLAAPAGIARCQAGLLAAFRHSPYASPIFLLQLHDIGLAQWLTQSESADMLSFVRGTLQGLAQVQGKPYTALMRAAMLGVKREGLLRTTLEDLARHAAHAFTVDRRQDLAAADTMPVSQPSFNAQSASVADADAVSELARLRNWLRYGIWQAEVGTLIDDWLSSLPDALLLEALREAGPAAALRLLYAPPAWRRHIMALLAGPIESAIFALQERIAQADVRLRIDEVRFARQVEQCLLIQLLSGQTDLDVLRSALADELAQQFFLDYDEIYALIAGVAPLLSPVPAPALMAMLGALLEGKVLDDAVMPDFAAAQQGLHVLRVLHAAPAMRSLPVTALSFTRQKQSWWRPPVAGALNVARPSWLRGFSSPVSGAAERAQLLHWLETGRWPWWAADRASPVPMLRRQLAHEPASLLAQLHAIVEVQGVLPRLLRLFSASSLSALVVTLQPALGGFILTWIKAGAALADTQTFNAQQRRRSVDLHWRVALAYLLRAPGAVLTPGAFVGDASRLCALHLNVPTEIYVAALRQAASAGARRDTRYKVLLDVLEPSADSVVPATSAAPKPLSAAVSLLPIGVASLAASPVPLIYRYRALGAMPEVGVDQPQATILRALEGLLRYGQALTLVQLRGLDSVITQLVTAGAARRRRWRTLIRDAAGRALERNRLSTLLPTPLLVRLLPLLLPQPAAAELIVLMAAWSTIWPSADRRRAVCLAWDVLLETLHLQRAQPWSTPRFLLALAERCRMQYGHRPLSLLARLEAALPPHGEAQLIQARRSMASAILAATSATLPKKRMPARIEVAKADESILPAEQALYLGNAGMVLLWPFLTRYFELQGLVKDGSFVDDKARSRAVYLLQFLASGSHEAPEHELLLNKLLCGMPAAVSPEFVDLPDEQAINNGLSLLRAVTQRWEKLKNTSVDGLRETFLMREGKLLLQEDKLTLTVSHKAYDMLLDSLPWSYSMIKLPWMHKVLFVQWR